MSRLTADLMLLTAAAIWGLAFYFQKTAMDDLGPFAFIAARAMVAVVVLAPLALREHARSGYWPSGLAPMAVVAGAVFCTGGAIQQYGIATTSITNTSFLTGLYVVLTPLLLWLTTGAPPSRATAGAIALAFLGTWLLGGGTLSGFSTGDALVAASALFWSVHMVMIGASARHGRPLAFVLLQFAVVAALALPATILSGQWPAADAFRRALPAVLFVGVLSTALTFGLLAIAMRRTPPAEAAILVNTEVLVAAVAGAVLLGERLTATGWVGAGLMLASGLAVQLIAAREQSRDAPAAARPDGS